MSDYTEAIATSLIPLDTIVPEIYAFIIGFSCTVWTKLRTLAGLLADCVLAILILPSTDVAHQYKDGKGSSKKVRKQLTEKQFTSK